jgi:hypothetical protein
MKEAKMPNRIENGVQTVNGAMIENPPLPSPFDQRVYDKAVEFDEKLAYGPLDQAPLDAAVRDYTAVVRENLWGLPIGRQMIDFSWPSSWYIPGAANHQDYWPLYEPPYENRYSHEWKTNSYDTASSATGDIGAWRVLLPNERFASAESGIGFLYRPPFSSGVVSLRPDVDCTGNLRWWQMLEQIAGDTHTTTELILAMWHETPGGWNLVHKRVIPVADGFRQSGMGYSAVRSYQRSFTGAQLATKFTVHKSHRYLFGIVARVNISSTLTNLQGGPIPEPPNLENFRIWGAIMCRVPFIRLRTKTVYVP